ncbi:MAG: hypothetical protein AAGB26_16605 [Planctomycetota bacterium]
MTEQEKMLDELIQSLIALIDLLRREPDCHWLKAFDSYLLMAGELKRYGYTQDDLNRLEAAISSSYGGMGSFSDYTPYQDGAVVHWVDELDCLRTLVCEQAFALKMQSRWRERTDADN